MWHTSELIQTFIIGANILVIIPFIIAIYSISDLRDTINLTTYPLIAMTYFGVMNVLALWLGQVFNLTLFQRLLLITVISVLTVSFWITFKQMYAWQNPARWALQYLLIAIGHALAFLVIIYGIYSTFQE